MKILNAQLTVPLMLMAACVVPAHAQRSCDNGMLSGRYSFRITGQILAGPSAGLSNGVALVNFDGGGKMISKDHVVVNGLQPLVEWRDSTGSYSVNADCTGKAQIDFGDGGAPSIVYHFILTRGKKQLDVVVANTGTNVSVVATRM